MIIVMFVFALNKVTTLRHVTCEKYDITNLRRDLEAILALFIVLQIDLSLIVRFHVADSE